MSAPAAPSSPVSPLSDNNPQILTSPASPTTYLAPVATTSAPSSLISNTSNSHLSVSSHASSQQKHTRKSTDFRIKFQDQGAKFLHIQLWLSNVIKSQQQMDALEAPVREIGESELTQASAAKRMKGRRGTAGWKKLLDK